MLTTPQNGDNITNYEVRDKAQPIRKRKMKKTNALNIKKRMLATLMCFIVAGMLIVLPMINAYGEDNSEEVASISVNIHGVTPPMVPSADMLAADAGERAATEEVMQQEEASTPETGLNSQTIVLWISLGLTTLVIVLAANAIRRMEK